MAPEPKSWAVVVPVKRLGIAKTRLAVGPALRHELALAMALDTVSACLEAPSVAEVLVVTDDHRAAKQMQSLGARVVADVPDAGLNPALVHGVQFLASLHPDAGVAAVSSDLPALSAPAVEAVLALAAAVDLACVSDAAGTGTTVLAARSASSFRPSFGASSLRRHTDAGAVDFSAAADPGVRRDVDTIEDLAGAIALGCGAETTTLLAAHPDWNRAAARH